MQPTETGREIYRSDSDIDFSPTKSEKRISQEIQTSPYVQFKPSESAKALLPNVSINGDWMSPELEKEIEDLIPSDQNAYHELTTLILEGDFVEFGKRFQQLQRTSSQPTTNLAEAGRFNAIAGTLKKTFDELCFSSQFDSEGKMFSFTRFNDLGARPGTQLLHSMTMTTDGTGKTNYYIQFRNGLDYSKPSELTGYSIDSNGTLTKMLLVETGTGMNVKETPKRFSIAEVNSLVKVEFESITDQKERDKKQKQKDEKIEEEQYEERKKQNQEFEGQMQKLEREQRRQLKQQQLEEQKDSKPQTEQKNSAPARTQHDGDPGDAG